MPNPGTEPYPTHPFKIRLITRQCLPDRIHPLSSTEIVTGKEVLNLAHVIAPITPQTVVAEIDAIADPKVMERTEQLLFEGLGQANLSGKITPEVWQDTAAVHTLRRRGKAK